MNFTKLNNKATNELYELLKGNPNVRLITECGDYCIEFKSGEHTFYFTSEVVE